MTFNEFVTAAEAISPDYARGISVRVEHKRYDHRPERPVLEFNIWDPVLHNHFTASDPETALALYRNAVAPAPVTETLGALGTPAL